MYLIFGTGKNQGAVPNPSPSLPIATSTTPGSYYPPGSTITTAPQTIGIKVVNGGTLIAKDFLNNGETVADTQNQNNYYLAGPLGYCLPDGSCPSGASTTDFTITYNSKSSYFTIALRKEPLGSVRIEAEQFLLARLGITRQGMCNLNYYVGTTYWVNSIYDKGNLGFSFCPGATKLPN